MTRFLRLLDRFVDSGLLFVLVFAPLAFGAVEEWAQAVAQFAILAVFVAWVLNRRGPFREEDGIGDGLGSPA